MGSQTMTISGFNPKARWDRHPPGGGQVIPETEDSVNPGILDEKIEVLAYFKNSGIFPRAFIRNNKVHRIRKITYNWQERRGREVINFFSVDTGTFLYQISFNNTTYRWQIDRIIE